VLRNLGVRSLIIAGILTDQCIDSAARDACDLGYLVTIATDACATHSASVTNGHAQQPRLRPPAHHRGTGRRDRAADRR